MRSKFYPCGWARPALAGLLPILLPLSLHALPVIDPATRGLSEQIARAPHNLLSIEQLSACVVEEKGTLVLDISRAGTLLDGSLLDAQHVSGRVCAGPWPFEAEESGYAYRRFRLDSPVEKGRAVLPLKGLFNENLNSEGWTSEASVLVRVELSKDREGPDQKLAFADIPLRFRKEGDQLRRLPALLEGPLLCKMDSRTPGQVVVALKTDLPAQLAVEVEGVGLTPVAESGSSHEIQLAGLPVNRDLRYRVLLDGLPATEWLDLRLPGPGPEPVRFAFFGDSREEDGGGDRGYRGVNLHALEQLLGQAYVHDADFLLMGGDLITGYTIWPEDFRSQLQAWKQAAAGFWRERPVFAGIGNHETLLRIFKGPEVDWLGMDRWPYASESAEAVFAQSMCNPANGPAQSDPELPGYEETVFSTRMGCVTAIVFNNTWWYTEHAEKMGGCPQGYLLEDQLLWLEQEIRAAQADPACRHIVYVTHEPVFPTGGHVKDSMWHRGNNAVRAWKAQSDGQLQPLGEGVIDVRNRLVNLIAASPKSAVVLSGHEHVYSRMLLTPQVPAGDPARDDPDGDQRLCEAGEPCSPLPGLARNLWFITNGGASPYYAEEPTPWGAWWKAQAEPRSGYRFTSQQAVLVFEADERGLALTVYNPFGEQIEHLENLATSSGAE